MLRWIVRGFVLVSAVALTVGFHYFAAEPDAKAPAHARPPSPNVVYIDTSIRDKAPPDVE